MGFGIWRHKQQERIVSFPAGAQARKAIPIATGVLDYFPAALCAVAECSRAGNEQHNPGKPLHWDRAKSTDEADALIRHFMERGTVDTDGIRHSTKVAWRALALLQKEIEREYADDTLHATSIQQLVHDIAIAATPITAHIPHFSDTAEPGPVVAMPLHPPLINPLPRPDELEPE